TITLATRPGRGDDPGEEQTLMISSEALVTIDDGRGRRLSVKEDKLENVPVGAVAQVKMAMDQSAAMSMRVEGPKISVMLKALNPDKGTIVVGIPKNREEFDEKTITLGKGARITLDGNPIPLGELKAGENGPFVQVRLTLDQSSALLVSARLNPG